MKAERKEEEKWVPIVITLESKEEAQYLWHALNLSRRSLMDYGVDESVPFPVEKPGEMFSAIDSMVALFDK